MQGINQVSISGRVSNDPVLRGQGESAILAFSICVNERRRNQDGEWEDVPNFIDCALFGKRAETLSDMVHKGDDAFAAGKLRQSTWEKDGQRRSRTEINVKDFFFYPKKAKEAPQPSDPYTEEIPF